MSGRVTLRLGGFAAVAAVALAGGATDVAATASPGWRIVATVGTATTGELPGWFTASSAASAFSSWNCVHCSVSTRDQNFVEQWDGSSWQPIALPVPLNYPRSVVAFSASSASNLWSVASSGKLGIWNGTSWAVTSLPSWVLRASNSGDPFADASVFSPGNAWIFCVGALSQPDLAAQYRGGAWHKVSLPAAPVQVSAVAPNDIWAVGTLAGTSPTWVAMHFNGSAWRTLALPAVTVPAGDSAGYQIMATGPDSVWLGRTVGSFSHTASVALLHWTGSWHLIKVTLPTSTLGRMAQDGNGGLWMLATRGHYPKAVQYLDHYGPGGWTRQAIPTKPGATTSLQSLTWIPGTRSLWASGSLTAGRQETGDILKYGP